MEGCGFSAIEMRKIKVFDTTLRDGEQAPGCSMHIEEKCEMAHRLERLGVDVIEAGFAAASPGDYEAIRAVTQRVKNASVASLSRANRKDIDASYAALTNAVSPLLHIVISTSDIHMEHKLRMSREQVLEAIKDSVSYARTLCPNIEYSFEDATRSDRDFLVQAVRTALAAGATTVNIPDTVGYAVPSEIHSLITYLREQVPDLEEKGLSIHCHNDMGLAVANSVAAVLAGATQVECTVNGIGERAGNAALEEIVMALHTRSDIYGVETNIVTEQIFRASRTLSRITGIAVPPNKAIVGSNAFAHESGIHQHGILADRRTYEIISPASVGAGSNKLVLGKHSGRHAFEEYLLSLGYNFDQSRINDFFADFKQLCDRKKDISSDDVEAIIMHKAAAIPTTYTLSAFVVNSSNIISSTANVTLECNGEKKEGVAMGDGPVDASFKAIENITGLHMKLEDYSIRSVSDGGDALGEVSIRVSCNGRQFIGKGLSTDIIESSLLAYVNAVNRILSADSGEAKE